MKNKKKIAIMSAALAGVAMVGGVFAYFTDTESATNTFTLGEIEIDLLEENWVEANATNLVPMQTIAKDPVVKNVGTNDAFVFLKVEVPYANVVTANAVGEKQAAADTELFNYTIDSANWVEVGTPTKANGVVTHVYAYAKDGEMQAIAKDASTSALFSSVTVANIIEDENSGAATALENSTQTVKVTAHAIQTTNVNGGVSDPDGVWTVVANQTAASN